MYYKEEQNYVHQNKRIYEFCLKSKKKKEKGLINKGKMRNILKQAKFSLFIVEKYSENIRIVLRAFLPNL